MKLIRKISVLTWFMALVPVSVLTMEHVSFISPTALKNSKFASGRSVAEFLEKAYKKNNVSRDFKSADCLRVHTLTQELKGAPWATKQLYLVSSTYGPKKAYYILKEIAKDPQTRVSPTHEINRLVHAASSKRLAPYIYPKSQKGFPQFIFPIAYLGYKHKGKNHYLALMPQAQGVSLGSLMKQLKAKPQDKITMNQIAEAYFYLGKAMANFYKKFGTADKTIIQGDLHASNIFYDARNHQITLIDNERMKKSLEKPMSIAEDLDFLLFKSIFVLKWTHRLNGFPAEKWYKLTIPTFISGFLSTYPQNNVKPIFDKLAKKITSGHWYKEALKDLKHKKHIEPITDTMNEKWSTLEAFATNVDINTKRDGKTNLHKRAASGTVLVRPLLLAGADVNARDNDQNTPLHEAAWYNNPKVIELLVMAGADMNAKDKAGNTPLKKAIINNSNAAIKKLKELGAK